MEKLCKLIGQKKGKPCNFFLFFFICFDAYRTQLTMCSTRAAFMKNKSC